MGHHGSIGRILVGQQGSIGSIHVAQGSIVSICVGQLRL